MPKINIIDAIIAMHKKTKAITGSIKEATNCNIASLKATISKITASTIAAKADAIDTIANIFAVLFIYLF